MSKEGSLTRIELYKLAGNVIALEKEEAYYKANYVDKEVKEVKKAKK